MRLIDADALKKEIRENDPFGGMNYEWYIDHAPTIAPWHRVEEPPKEGQNVLTMDANEDMETATYDGEGFEDSYGFYVTDVLYWMPIEPPKEDVDGNK